MSPLLRPFAFALAALAAAPATAAAAPDPGPVEREILVVHRAGLGAGERAELRAGAGVTLRRRVLAQGELVAVRGASRATALAELRADPDVLIAEPNRVVRAAADPLQPVQWALANEGPGGAPDHAVADADADFPEAWAYSRGAGVTVGVVDTGVAGGHPDLATQLAPGKSFTGGDPQHDPDGHGTHVAGIIVAAENGIGVVGGAPHARVMPLQVLGAGGSGTTADLAEAVEYAGQAGLRIVNASLASEGSSRTLDWLIGKYFTTLFVVSAGNAGVDVDGADVSAFPCESPSPNVLCVGASDAADRAAAFSNRGPRSVDLHAPGTDIVSSWPGDGWMRLEGTSMAAPMVAAAAALLAARNPQWPAARIKQALLAGADPRPALAGLSATGARLNAARAFALAQAGDATLPSAPTGFAAAGEPGRASLRWDPATGEVAGFRLYRVEGDRRWTPLTVTGHHEFVVEPLAPGGAEFALTAFDAFGNESPPARARAEIPGGAPPAAGPAATVPRAAPRVAVTRLVRLGPRLRPRGARLVLSGAARVTVTLSRKGARGRYVAVVRRRLEVPTGRRVLKVRRGRLLGRRLSRGSWRLSVVAPGGRVVLRFGWR